MITQQGVTSQTPNKIFAKRKESLNFKSLKRKTLIISDPGPKNGEFMNKTNGPVVIRKNSNYIEINKKIFENNKRKGSNLKTNSKKSIFPQIFLTN